MFLAQATRSSRPLHWPLWPGRRRSKRLFFPITPPELLSGSWARPRLRPRTCWAVFVVSSAVTTSDKIKQIRDCKGRQRFAALTVYDFAMAKMLENTGIPLLLVGDSLGMVVLGYPDTTQVTMADMEHHLRAAARARPGALLAADLPYGSCVTPASAVENARRLIAAGAEAVKIE